MWYSWLCILNLGGTERAELRMKPTNTSSYAYKEPESLTGSTTIR
jgi:hypothetical protein